MRLVKLEAESFQLKIHETVQHGTGNHSYTNIHNVNMEASWHNAQPFRPTFLDQIGYWLLGLPLSFKRFTSLLW